jgi:hypothetical protein
MPQHGRKAIEKVGKTQPAALLKIIALTLPKEHKVEHSRSVSELSDQQLNDMIEALSARLEARAAGIDVGFAGFPGSPGGGNGLTSPSGVISMSGGTSIPAARASSLADSASIMPFNCSSESSETERECSTLFSLGTSKAQILRYAAGWVRRTFAMAFSPCLEKSRSSAQITAGNVRKDGSGGENEK